MIVAAVLFVSLSAGILVVGGGAIDRSRAQTAADAAALASLRGGRRAALDLAERHGAELVSFTVGPISEQVTVVVRVGDAIAMSVATDAP